MLNDAVNPQVVEGINGLFNYGVAGIVIAYFLYKDYITGKRKSLENGKLMTKLITTLEVLSTRLDYLEKGCVRHASEKQ